MQEFYNTIFRTFVCIVVTFSSTALSQTKTITITKGQDISIANPAAVQQKIKEPNNGKSTTVTVASFKC